MSNQQASRRALCDAIKDAGVVIHGLSGFPPNMRIDFASNATAQDRQTVQGIVDAWDWSDANAQLLARDAKRTKVKALLSDSSSDLMRAVLAVLMDEINILRTRAGLQERTKAQLVQAITNKIDAGEVD